MPLEGAPKLAARGPSVAIAPGPSGVTGTGSPADRDALSEANGQPSIKRKRVSRACDFCRRERERCDGIKPICSTCTKSKRPCSYNDNQKKRGVQSGYLRGLEFTLGWLLSHNEGVEEYLDYRFYQCSTTKLLKARSEENEDAYALHKRWTQSRACQDLERVLCGELPQPKQERSLEATGSPEVLLPFSGRGADSPALSFSIGSRASDSLFAKTNTEQHEPGLAQVEVKLRRDMMLRLPADPWPLLDYFFAYTQCWFPIIERQDVLRTVHLSSNQPAELCDDALPAYLFELWAILALASVQKEASARRSAGLRNTSDSTDHAIHELCDRLITLVPLMGQERMEIGHVRAMLLLAIVEIERQHWSIAWLLVGHASRAGIDMGLHQTPCSSNELGYALPSKRAKHVMLGCFILDSAISFRLRRSSFLQSSHIVPIGLLTEDGLEEWNSWEGLYSEDRCQVPCRVPQHSLSIYNALVGLMQVLSQSAGCDASCFKGPKFDFLGALTSWQEKLPLHIDFRAIGSGTAHPTPQLFSLYFIKNYLVANVCNNDQRTRLVSGLCETNKVYAGFLKNTTLSPMIKCFSDPEDKLSNLNDLLPTRVRQNFGMELIPQDLRAEGITSGNGSGLGNVWGVQNLPDVHVDQGPAFFARSSVFKDQLPSTMNTTNAQKQLHGQIETPDFRPSLGNTPRSSHNNARIPRGPFNTASTGQFEVVPVLTSEGMDYNSSMPTMDPAMNYGMSIQAAHDTDLFDDLNYFERANEQHSEQLFMQNLGLVPGVEMVDFPWDIVN